MLLYCYNKCITSRNIAVLVTKGWTAIAKGVTNSRGFLSFGGDMPWAQSTGVIPSRDLRATPDSSCLGLQELESQIVFQEAAER